MHNALEMTDSAEIRKKIGGLSHNTGRREWAVSKEGVVKDILSRKRFGVSWDPTAVQGADFSAYGYTEFMTGMCCYTLSSDINYRVMREASKSDIDHALIDHLLSKMTDKYHLHNSGLSAALNVVLLPGSNMWSMVNFDTVDRLAGEIPNIVFKPHPLATVENIRQLKIRVGDHRVISAQSSAMSLLHQVEKVWTTTSSELGIYATLLSKPVYDITKWEYVTTGSYAALMRPVFALHHQGKSTEARELLCRMLSSRQNGLLFPIHHDTIERIEAYRQLTLQLRETYAPLGPVYKRLHNENAK